MKFDWAKIEQEYVTGKMGLREIADKYHVAMSTLSKHAKVADFTGKREKYRKKVAQKALTRASTRDAKAISRIMTAAEKTIAKLRGAITEDTIYGYITQDPPGKDEETGERVPAAQRVVLLSKADTKALVNITTAIRNLAVATKVMYPEGDGAGKEDERSVVIMPEREEDDGESEE